MPCIAKTEEKIALKTNHGDSSEPSPSSKFNKDFSAERKPYVTQAGKLHSAYTKDTTEAEKNIIKVDDEADSAMVGKFDQFYEDYGYYETSDDEDEPYHSRGFKSLNTTEWETAIEGGT
ncbi:hypothetical protein GOBAR_AA05591 [Gossypium barbadense]|uniref:Uncharacterized protein n=1 Tax=Gossypium barbadense TaxID=3634 RepID=A0A2P5YHC4_GOSBA|nr:hypothetical protein GOBAR_AA05591 [Gossypium barbadense]